MKTIFALAAGLGLLSLILKSYIPAVVAATILLAAIMSKTLRRIISDGWLRLAHLIGKVNTLLLLAVVFYAVLMPLALLRQFLSKLFRGPKAAATAWQERNHTFSPADLEKMW